MATEEDPPEVLERFHASLELVERLARKLSRTLGGGVSAEELKSFGMEGLLEASRRFEPERGVPFGGYAYFRVRGAILDGVRSLSRLPRRVHQRLKLLDVGSHLSEGAYEDLAALRMSAESPRWESHQAEQALHDHLAAVATAMATGFVSATAWDEDGIPAPVDRAPTPEAATVNAQLLQVICAAIDELPSEEGELVRRHYLEGERFDRVAGELQLSKSWASRLHKRAMERLTKRVRARL